MSDTPNTDVEFDLSSAPSEVVAGRFTLSSVSAKSAEGGDVYRGMPTANKNKVPHVVHVPRGRGIEAIPAHVVGTSLTSESIIPVAQVVAAFIKAERLGDLESAIAKCKKDAGAK